VGVLPQYTAQQRPLHRAFCRRDEIFREAGISGGKGAAGRAGRWRIYAARTKSQDEALAIYDKLRNAGYPATINPAQADGGTLYQVRITGLLSETDGTTIAIRLKTELGLEHVAVSLQ